MGAERFDDGGVVRAHADIYAARSIPGRVLNTILRRTQEGMNIFKRSTASKSDRSSRRNRQPPGVPSGGEFATETKPAADFTLPAVPDPHFDYLHTILHSDHEGGPEAAVREAQHVYGDDIKGINTVGAMELMDEADLHLARASNLDDGEAKAAHTLMADAMKDVATRVSEAQTTAEAAGAIASVRMALALEPKPEGWQAERTFRYGDYSLAYVQRRIERDDRVRTGATDPVEGNIDEQDRWAAALADQARGGPVTVGDQTDLTPEQARTIVAANALGDLRFEYLRDCHNSPTTVSAKPDCIDALGELPEAIEAAGSPAERIAAVQAARERLRTVQDKHGPGTYVREVSSHLDEADRLLGKNYDWAAAVV